MNILIVGAGEVGAHLCETLSRRGHAVTVIERDEAVANRLDEELDVRVLRDSGASADTLRKAGVEGCDLFLAMTSHDEVNLVAASLAHALGARRTFARAHDQTFRDSAGFNYRNHFSIDHLLNPERLAAVEIAKAIRSPGRVAVENFARGQIEVQLVEVQEGAALEGKPLSESRLAARRVGIGLIQRGDALEVPDGASMLRAGDLVTLFGPPEMLYEVRPLFDPQLRSRAPVSVVLMGGGEIAVSLIRLLKGNRFHIRVIERDPRLCRDLAARFPKVNVVHGDGTSLRLLEEEQVGQADYFVACTRDDEDNVMTCLQVSKLGCPHVMLAINRSDYVEVLNRFKDTLGVEFAVSPREATAAEILRHASPDSFVELARLPGDAARIVEFPVIAGGPLEGRRLRDAVLPPQTRIVAHMHRDEARSPAADDVFHVDDRIVAIVRTEQLPRLRELTRR